MLVLRKTQPIQQKGKIVIFFSLYFLMIKKYVPNIIYKNINYVHEYNL